MADSEENPQGNFSKSDFNRFVKDTLEKGEEIKRAYGQLIEGVDGKEAIVSEIETSLEKIKDGYENLFVTQDAASNSSKIEELNRQIKEIREYHSGLLQGDDTKKSIKKEINDIETDIKESQERITKFYIELFGSAENDNGGKEAEVNRLIKEITDFHTDVTKASGYKDTIEKAYEKIVIFNEELFVTKDKDNNTKVEKLKEEIKNISDFNINLEKNIKGFIKETKDDIATKRDDIGRLLASAIAPSLLQGYLDSKNEYRRIPKYEKLTGRASDCLTVVPINLFRLLQSLTGLIADHVFFIVPLLLAVVILSFPGNIPTSIGLEINGNLLEELSFINRLLVSLPLWWISLFGYKNIRNKSHLSEEYNHKAQVTRMYIKFTSDEDSDKYPIDEKARAQLNAELIETIGRNPSEVYGRDDTILDKLTDLVGAWKEKRSSNSTDTSKN